jgi:tetratricopeptide (TPR) repeat protein
MIQLTRRAGMLLTATASALLAAQIATAEPPMLKGPPEGALVDPKAAARAQSPLTAPIPDQPKARRRLLSDLYAHLAAARDEEQARAAAERIERIWAARGTSTAQVLVERAAKAQAEKRTDLAERLFDHAVDLAPDFPEVWSRRAYFNYQRGAIVEALGDLRRVLALDPSHFKAMEGLAQIFKELGNSPAAYAVYKRLIEVHPFAPGAQQAIDELKFEVEGREL